MNRPPSRQAKTSRSSGSVTSPPARDRSPRRGASPPPFRSPTSPSAWSLPSTASRAPAPKNLGSHLSFFFFSNAQPFCFSSHFSKHRERERERKKGIIDHGNGIIDHSFFKTLVFLPKWYNRPRFCKTLIFLSASSSSSFLLQLLRAPSALSRSCR